MKSKKNALDTLAEKPTFVLSYGTFGSETWSTRERLTDPLPNGERTKWPNVSGGLSTDQLILQILKKNPGTELQFSSNYGLLPCFALHLNECKAQKLQLPDGVFYADGSIWVKWEEHGVNLCLLETR